MEYHGNEERSTERKYVEPYKTNIFLIFSTNDKSYRFNLLDISPKGIGMLVEKGDEDVLNFFTQGDMINMEYSSRETEIPMDFIVKHITSIERGDLIGHYQIGLELCSENENHD